LLVFLADGLNGFGGGSQTPAHADGAAHGEGFGFDGEAHAGEGLGELDLEVEGPGGGIGLAATPDHGGEPGMTARQSGTSRLVVGGGLHAVGFRSQAGALGGGEGLGDFLRRGQAG